MRQYNIIQACSDIKRDTIPKLLLTSSDEVATQQLREIIEYVEADCQEGFGKCRDAIALKQLHSGTYQPVYEAVCLRSFLTETWGSIPRLTIEIDERVPLWLSLSIPLLLIIMQNSTHNAKSHGKKNGQLHLTVNTVHINKKPFLRICLRNQPGKNHDIALQMQLELGENMLLSPQAGISLGKIGNTMSTLLGMAEIQTAAVAMTANVDLTFHPDTRVEPAYVAFVLQLPLVVASDPGPVDLGSKLKLREGTFMLCVDDDKLTRMMCKFLALECGVNASHSSSTRPIQSITAH